MCLAYYVLFIGIIGMSFHCISVVTMPSPQYYIELDNSTVAYFDPASSTAEGLVAGSTELKLKGHSILGLRLILIALTLLIHCVPIKSGPQNK